MAEKKKQSLLQSKLPVVRSLLSAAAPLQFRPIVDPLLRQQKDKIPEPTVSQSLRLGKELSILPALSRQTISFGQSIAGGVTGERPGPYRPKSDLGRFLLEPTADFEGVLPQREKAEKALSFGQEKAGTAGAIGAGVIGAPLLQALEVTPGGGGKKQVGKKIAEQIAEATPRVRRIALDALEKGVSEKNIREKILKFSEGVFTPLKDNSIKKTVGNLRLDKFDLKDDGLEIIENIINENSGFINAT